MNQRTLRLPRRVMTLVAAGGLATAGAAALATGWTASATPGDAHQVWVCAYIGPQSDQVLKPGKNPLLVDEAILQGGKFRGSDDDAVIVDSGDVVCAGKTPGPTSSTTTTAATAEPATTEPTTTGPTTAEPTKSEPTKSEPTTTAPTTTAPTTTVPTSTAPTSTVPTSTTPATTV